MRYLVDTHIMLWMRTDRKKLSNALIELLSNTENAIYYSVLCPWELAIKHAKKKLVLPDDFFTTFPRLGFECLPVEEHHIASLRMLPLLHNDPFDRMLVAQAAAEKMTFITRDSNLVAYPVKTLLV